MKYMILLLLPVFLWFCLPAGAQEIVDSVPEKPEIKRMERSSTPVENDDYKSPKPLLHFYDRHGNPLAEPVLILVDEDTTATPGASPVYPKLMSVSAGINFADALMMLAGQKYSSFDFWGSLSLYNWIFPTVEIGLGRAKKTPDSGQFTYNGKPSLYVRAGLDYNFLYKSDPDYSAFVGLRAGFSAFSYSIDNISITSDYWNQAEKFALTGQKASAFYGSVLAGIKVKIYDRFSLGWSVRYNFLFHTKSGSASDPWFIPGYGAKGSSPISVTFSAIYTLPLPHRESAVTSK